VIPEGVGSVNQEGLDFYRRLCDELNAIGVRPYLTLYHWDLPQALQDRGGWLNPDVVGWFSEYAALINRELGGMVESIATFNEPWCSAFLGHSAGEHAPGLEDPGKSYVAAHHLMLAHHAGMAAMREGPDGPDLGIVLNLIPAWPASDDEADRVAAEGVDAVNNKIFLDAVFTGTYPDLIAGYHEKLGVGGEVDAGRLARSVVPIDFLGVNYYNINRFAHKEGGSLPSWPGVDDVEIVTPPGHLTEMGWGVEPHGLRWMLERTFDEYGPIPMFVTENGAAYPDEPGVDGAVHDADRRDYIRSHIGAVHDAMENGVDVRGYFVWSLLDNFEWAKGYSKRFGIVRVDYDTMERTVKESGHWYRAFLGDE
jgi:beta-glucosidase